MRCINRFLLIVFLLAAVTAAIAAPIKIVVTTSLIGSVISDVGGKNVKLHVFTASSGCPGNFDCKPSDMTAVNSSKFIFYHGFESYIGKIVKGSSGKPKVIVLAKDKNLLVPNNYIAAVKTVRDILIKFDPQNKKIYTENSNSAINKINRINKNIKSKSGKLKGIKVICADANVEFVKYLGFDVVGTYPNPDSLSAKKWSDISKAAKNRRVKLTIDNFQTGQYVTSQLAKDVKAKHIVLSNFPGAYKNTATYEKCVMKNLDICLKAVK